VPAIERGQQIGRRVDVEATQLVCHTALGMRCGIIVNAAVTVDG
jgi:hypothetical protein